MIAARRIYENFGKTWVDFYRTNPVKGVFTCPSASQMVREWASNAGIVTTDYDIRWDAVSFSSENDAMLCYLRFK